MDQTTVAVVGDVTMPNGSAGVEGRSVFGGVELAVGNALYRSARTTLSGEYAASAGAWSGFGLKNDGTTSVRGCAQLPACCRAGGPLLVRLAVYSANAGTVTASLSTASWMASPGGPSPGTATRAAAATVTVPAGCSRVTVYAGDAPTQTASVPGSALVFDVKRETDAEAANEIVVVAAELLYVHQSWGVTLS